MLNAKDKILLVLVVSVMILAGCKSRKTVTETPSKDMASYALVSASPAVNPSYACMSGNLKLAVNVSGTPFSAKGSIRIKENEGVQIGVTALGLVEIACLEFFPDNARLIYKLGKEYTDVEYSDVIFLQKSGIDFEMLESVLMNRMFSPDGQPVVKALKDMELADEGHCVIVRTKPVNGIVYKFYVDKVTGNLVQSEGIHESGGNVTCTYSDFYDIDGIPVPHFICLSLKGAGTDVSLSFTLNRVDLGEFVFAPRNVSSSYKKLEPKQMLKSIVNK